MTFKGSGVALVTPFTGKKVNYDVLQSLLDFHLKEKTDFLVILGSTAEAATLSINEKKQIIDFVIPYINHRIPVVVGTGSNDTRQTISFSKYAKNAGADGLLVVTPYYNKPTQKGLIAHYKAVAKSVDLPIIVYNVPGRTGVNMTPETNLELSKIKNIYGNKEASGDLNQIKRIIEIVPKDYVIFSGNDDQLLDVLRLGGKGIISVSANIIPGVIQQQIKDYFNGINIENSISHYLPLHQAMFIETNPVPVKRALEVMGYPVGKPRLPLVKLEKKHEKELINVLNQYHLVKS